MQTYLNNPRAFIGEFAGEMSAAREEIMAARARLKSVIIPDAVARPAIELIQKLGIDSLRAELTWFESARAYAAAEVRDEVTFDDLRAVAPMALRLRRSKFMNEYFDDRKKEEGEVGGLLKDLGKKAAPRLSGSNRKRK